MGIFDTMPRIIDQSSVFPLYENILHALESYADGEKFSSFQTLIRQYDCTRRELEFVLKMLQKEGRVRVVPCQGIFVCRSSTPACRVVLLRSDWPIEYRDHLEKYMVDHLEKLPGVSVQIKRMPQRKVVPEDFLNALNPETCDIGVTYCNFSGFSLNDTTRLLNCGVPLIFLENHIFNRTVNLVDSMPEYSGMMIADYLIKKGHRKIALVNGEIREFCLRRELDGFCSYLALQGIPVEYIDCTHSAGISAFAVTEEKFAGYVKKNGIQASALFCSGPSCALAVKGVLEELGYSIPDDISIIFNSDVPSMGEKRLSLTGVSRDFEGYARCVAQMVSEIRQGRNPGIVRVPSFLVERTSVKDMNDPNQKETKGVFRKITCLDSEFCKRNLVMKRKLENEL